MGNFMQATQKMGNGKISGAFFVVRHPTKKPPEGGSTTKQPLKISALYIKEIAAGGFGERRSGRSVDHKDPEPVNLKPADRPNVAVSAFDTFVNGARFGSTA